VKTEGSSGGGIRSSANYQPLFFRELFNANAPCPVLPPSAASVVRVRVMYIYKI